MSGIHNNNTVTFIRWCDDHGVIPGQIYQRSYLFLRKSKVIRVNISGRDNLSLLKNPLLKSELLCLLFKFQKLTKLRLFAPMTNSRPNGRVPVSTSLCWESENFWVRLFLPMCFHLLLLVLMFCVLIWKCEWCLNHIFPFRVFQPFQPHRW